MTREHSIDPLERRDLALDRVHRVTRALVSWSAAAVAIAAVVVGYELPATHHQRATTTAASAGSTGSASSGSTGSATTAGSGTSTANTSTGTSTSPSTTTTTPTTQAPVVVSGGS